MQKNAAYKLYIIHSLFLVNIYSNFFIASAPQAPSQQTGRPALNRSSHKKNPPPTRRLKLRSWEGVRKALHISAWNGSWAVKRLKTRANKHVKCAKSFEGDLLTFRVRSPKIPEETLKLYRFVTCLPVVLLQKTNLTFWGPKVSLCLRFVYEGFYYSEKQKFEYYVSCKVHFSKKSILSIVLYFSIHDLTAILFPVLGADCV